MSTVGTRIKEIRKEKGMTQTDLAKILRQKYGLKTDRTTISKWETGNQEPEMYPIKCMAEIFDVSMDYLNGLNDLRAPYENMHETILKLRLKNNMTIADIAKALNINAKVVADWEAGIATGQMRLGTIEDLAKLFRVSPSYLMGWEEEGGLQITDGTGVQIPILGRVAAGDPIEAIEEAIGYEEISRGLAATGDYFALKIQGDSMAPRIQENDIVIVKKQEDCDSGDIAVVMVNDQDATVKRIKKTDDTLMLIATNLAYDPLLFSSDEIKKLPVKIIGKVVELRAKF